jgi:hypothetical protein
VGDKMEKVHVDGKIMWQENNGTTRRKEPDKKPDMYGWHRVTVEGRKIWESPEGEREEY